MRVTKGPGLDYAQSYAVLREYLRLEGGDLDRYLPPMEEKPTRAHIRGVQEALNDIMSTIADWPNDKVRALAAKLQSEFGIDLAKLFHATSAKARRVLKRGAIRTDTEFYLLRSWVDQSGEPDSDRDEAWKLLDAYEFRG